MGGAGISGLSTYGDNFEGTSRQRSWQMRTLSSLGDCYGKADDVGMAPTADWRVLGSLRRWRWYDYCLTLVEALALSHGVASGEVSATASPLRKRCL